MTCTETQAGFASLRVLWREMLDQAGWSSVFHTPEWQQTWWDQFGGEGWALRLLAIGPEDAPLGIAPMVMRDRTMSFLGDTDLFDYHDFIGESPAFYAALVDCLDGEPWDVLDLRSVPGFSPTLTHLVDLYRVAGYSVTVDEEDVVPGAALPSTWDEYLAGLRKKDRHELRRKLRRLDALGDVRLVRSDAGTLERDVDLFLDLMRESKEEKRHFMSPDRETFFREVVRRVHEAGHLQLLSLDMEGERLASVICFDYKGTRFLYNSGYRLEYRAASVGLMLKALSVKDAIESGLSYFDFLRGPEPYKYHLGGADVRLYSITVRR